MDAALFRLSFKHFESESIKFEKKSVDLLMDCYMGKKEGDEGGFFGIGIFAQNIIKWYPHKAYTKTQHTNCMWLGQLLRNFAAASLFDIIKPRRKSYYQLLFFLLYTKEAKKSIRIKLLLLPVYDYERTYDK